MTINKNYGIKSSMLPLLASYQITLELHLKDAGDNFPFNKDIASCEITSYKTKNQYDMAAQP